MSLNIEVLPIELEREIFETAAARDPKCIPTLLRVCHRVHTWLEPLLYAVLELRYWDNPLIYAVESKSAPFLNAAVRHAYLYFDGTQKAVKATGLLSKCSQLINLALMGDFDSDILDSIQQMRPRKLHIAASRRDTFIWGLVTFKVPFFLSVTHLCLFYAEIAPEQERWHDWSSLASLPALTHLSLSESLSRDILRDALTECPQVLLAITSLWGNSQYKRDRAIAFAQSLTIRDPRIVVMLVPDYMTDWETGARGGADYWVRAEEFVARKRLEKGETAPICYLLDESDVAI
ncbi:hypothetical protein DFH06DRAFT_1481805 [Mycena polygramma]|nr:hypothetical protein DFH06DRAFT_1481805 [Mycena polygramma]